MKLISLILGIIIGLVLGWFLREVMDIDLVGNVLDRFIE